MNEFWSDFVVKNWDLLECVDEVLVVYYSLECLVSDRVKVEFVVLDCCEFLMI